MAPAASLFRAGTRDSAWRATAGPRRPVRAAPCANHEDDRRELLAAALVHADLAGLSKLPYDGSTGGGRPRDHLSTSCVETCLLVSACDETR
jgi:hypothetical protein